MDGDTLDQILEVLFPTKKMEQEQPLQQPPPQEEEPKIKRERKRKGDGEPQAPKQQQQHHVATTSHAPAELFSEGDMEAMIKEMQLWNLYKQSPPAITVFLCKACRQTIYFDRQKVALAANDHVEMRFKMCALCRKGNLEIKKLFNAYWPYIA